MNYRFYAASYAPGVDAEDIGALLHEYGQAVPVRFSLYILEQGTPRPLKRWPFDFSKLVLFIVH